MIFTLTDTNSWLAYADYLQDQGLNYQQVLDGIENPQTNQWHYEYRSNGVGIGIGDIGIGDIGGLFGNTVGFDFGVGGFGYRDELVGGGT